eukprot:g16075.t1
MWVYLLTAAALLAVWWLIRDRQKIGDVKDKFVFITGCDTGFGNLLAKRLERQGFCVLAGCLTQKGVDGLQRNNSSTLKTVLLDVADCSSIRKAVDWVQAEVGEKGSHELNALTSFISCSFNTGVCTVANDKATSVLALLSPLIDHDAAAKYGRSCGTDQMDMIYVGF